MKRELLQYIGDDLTLIDVNTIHAMGNDVIIKAGKVYIYYGEIEK